MCSVGDGAQQGAELRLETMDEALEEQRGAKGLRIPGRRKKLWDVVNKARDGRGCGRRARTLDGAVEPSKELDGHAGKERTTRRPSLGEKRRGCVWQRERRGGREGGGGKSVDRGRGVLLFERDKRTVHDFLFRQPAADRRVRLSLSETRLFDGSFEAVDAAFHFTCRPPSRDWERPQHSHSQRRLGIHPSSHQLTGTLLLTHSHDDNKAQNDKPLTGKPPRSLRLRLHESTSTRPPTPPPFQVHPSKLRPLKQATGTHG